MKYESNKNTWPEAILKMRLRARRDHIGSSTLSASSFTSRGECSRRYMQAGTQIRCSQLSDRHRLGLEGTAHSSQNVISMQMKGAGIRDRKVEMVTSPAGCHGELKSHIIRVKWGMKQMNQEPRGQKKREEDEFGVVLEEITPLTAGTKKKIIDNLKNLEGRRERDVFCNTTHHSFTDDTLLYHTGCF